MALRAGAGNIARTPQLAVRAPLEGGGEGRGLEQRPQSFGRGRAHPTRPYRSPRTRFWMDTILFWGCGVGRRESWYNPEHSKSSSGDGPPARWN